MEKKFKKEIDSIKRKKKINFKKDLVIKGRKYKSMNLK